MLQPSDYDKNFLGLLGQLTRLYLLTGYGLVSLVGAFAVVVL